jgi:hypothetical protein
LRRRREVGGVTGSMGKKKYLIPFIKDKKVFNAFSYAIYLKDDLPIEIAMSRAAKYYGVPIKELAKFMGIYASNVKAAKGFRKAARRE